MLPVSGYQKTERLVYFARMCSKARLMLQGVLPEPYHEYIGVGFDGRCCRFLKVEYADIQQGMASGKSDMEMLD
jgi:gluconokinase